MKNLPKSICAEVAGCSDYYGSFREAFEFVRDELADHAYYLDESELEAKFESSGCIKSEGCIDFCFTSESKTVCNDLVVFKWFTTRSGKINFTIRVK